MASHIAAVASVDGDRGRRPPGKFFITPHYDGYPGILVRLSQVDSEELTELLTDSWRICAPKRLLAAYDKDHPPAP
jgi:hypothetical protein